MTSPDDLNPPSYLHGSAHSTLSDPFTSPPPRRKSRFTSQSTHTLNNINTTTPKPRRESIFAGSEVSSPPNMMLPPPAVTTYAYARSHSSYANQRSPLHTLRQQSKHLTSQLQELLDAQSTALMSGGTFAPSDRAPKQQQQQQRGGGGRKGPPPMSLGDARNGIMRSMEELADIKDIEEDVYVSQVSDREALIKTVTTWGKKTKLLEAEIHTIEEGAEGQRMEELRTEKGELESEIQKLRAHLAKMEDKLAAVSIQLSENESIVSSKTSSYKASLSALKTKTSSFLASHRYASPATAIESWTLECEALAEKRAQARTEGTALRDGVVLWKNTLKLVGSFEEQLRTRMASAKRSRGDNIKPKILQDIEETIGKLEEILVLAEGRNWKLLCCCVGAELQVFLEAREMMKKSMEADQQAAGTAAGAGAGKRSTPTPVTSTVPTIETSKDSEDSGSQQEERMSQSQSRSSLRNGLSSFGLGPNNSTRKPLSGLRKSLNPLPAAGAGGLSLLDRRSDDGQSLHENDGDDERDESVDLLLKVDNAGDGVGDRPDYSPLDD